MKAWLTIEVSGSGLCMGKKDVLIIPWKDGKGLAVNFVDDGRVWIEEKNREDMPDEKSKFYEIEIPDRLANEVCFAFDVVGGSLAQFSKSLLIEHVAKIKP